MSTPLPRFKQDGREFGTMHPFIPICLEDDSQFAITYLWRKPGDAVPWEYDFVSRWEHAVVLEAKWAGATFDPAHFDLEATNKALTRRVARGVARAQV